MLRKGIRKILKKLLSPVLAILAKRYLKKSRLFKYEKLELKINQGVFHPGLFLSTKILLSFMKTIDLKNKSMLELGAGSGAVGFYGEILGANVTVSDINKKAIKGLEENKKRLNAKVKIIYSDLFDEISGSFDIIFINPPYYPKKPKNEEERAWFCGEDFDYFKKLCSQLNSHLNSEGKAYMILSEDCMINKIKNMAEKADYSFQLFHEKTKLLEKNYIFEVVGNK